MAKTNKTSLIIDSSLRKKIDSAKEIMPFFERVPLLTNKQTEFEMFKQIIELMLAKKHNENLEGFMTVLDLAEDLRVRTRAKKVRSPKKEAKVAELRAQLAREKLQKSAQLNQQS